jgi:uncharacterized protein
MIKVPYLGHGLGLRTEHYTDVLSNQPNVDWFEAISENFMVEGGNPRRVIMEVREHYPVVLHGVSMSLGSTDPLNKEHLHKLACLAHDLEPAWISDHLCWSSFNGHSVYDLWPLPYTEEALNHLTERIVYVQEFLGRQILVENVSSYVAFSDSSMTEWEFLSTLAQQADCGLLLDINNIYVSSQNHGFDPYAFVNGITQERVGQFHLAGHSIKETHLLDTHDHPVCDAVWKLYQAAVARFGNVSTLLERDDHIPPLNELLQELEKARGLAHEIIRNPKAILQARHGG